MEGNAPFTIKDPGHSYDVVTLGGGVQNIQFIKKEKGEDDKLKTITDGITNESLLAVLIDRMRFLDEKVPSALNKVVIRYLKWALDGLVRRTSDRQTRGVEGTDQK